MSLSKLRKVIIDYVFWIKVVMLNLMRKQKIAIANALTFSRIFLCLPLVYCIWKDQIYSTWSIIVLCGISDIADGAIAKSAGGGTKWGARFDPLADKLLINIALICLAIDGIIPAWSFLILVAREAFVTFLRSKAKNGLPASSEGKIKTFLQFTAILCFFFPFKEEFLVDRNFMNNLGLSIYWLSFIFSLYSAIKYIKRSIVDDHY